MAFKIYTRTGDKGKTSLIGGVRVPKSHIRIEAYGTVDELNSYIGMINDSVNQEFIRETLKEIQDRLFTIGSELATDMQKKVKMTIPDLHESDIVYLENQIDLMDKELKPLRSFILPGGHLSGSTCHVARCVCRRVERICVAVQESGEEIPELVIPYLNRLSDYLFTLARYIVHIYGGEEIEWKPRI
jgi:cob(I)alamin adenosyltransferase